MVARQTDRDANLTVICFSSLRGDWYRGVDLMVRLIARAAGGESIEFRLFPRQWLPLFALWRVTWSGSVDPPQPLPMVTDLDQVAICALIQAAAARGQLRIMVEAWAALDPLLADVLYRLDRRQPSPAEPAGQLALTGWQSYGRAEVRAFDRVVSDAAVKRSDAGAILLPCARSRPYGRSKTHRRIWKALAAHNIFAHDHDAIVISSIGVVPEANWDHPVALAYDSGVPDIWRVLRLMRGYFAKAQYDLVIDCLEFGPYSEAVAILAQEGLIGEVRRIVVGKPRSLPAP